MVRLHTAINRADFVSCCMLYTYTKVTKCIREKMTLYFVGAPSNHIHQHTKAARLVVVCKRTLSRRAVSKILVNLHGNPPPYSWR